MILKAYEINDLTPSISEKYGEIDARIMYKVYTYMYKKVSLMLKRLDYFAAS